MSQSSSAASHFSFTYRDVGREQLTTEELRLLTAAEKAAAGAYAPYSSFRVGAALLLENGEILTGANHENAAFPVGICAERVVLGMLDMSGPPVRAIAVTYQTDRALAHAPLSPCGLCRQSLLEVRVHQNAPIQVLMACPDANVPVRVIDDAAALLPLFFSGKNL
jgi:cytidine deaminase